MAGGEGLWKASTQETRHGRQATGHCNTHRPVQSRDRPADRLTERERER